MPGVQRGGRVRFTFDGELVEAFCGESIAAAALASGIRILRSAPGSNDPRGTFCWMGSCQECVVVVDGVRRPACRTPVHEGLVVTSGTI
ncbi:(2Fe-2S)-binding protein [Breoghania corrubedonensis]|uniref:(2Fe-2S)-binding protein n=1 Tax=Breoghania corrubedonensis TaxID=665038 RepID=UPI000D35F2C6